MEEDDKIKELFTGFNPAMDSDRDFMDRLTRSLDSVEMIRERATELRRRNRRAVVAAALVGFVTGIAFTLAMTFIKGWIGNLLTHIPSTPASTDTPAIIGWVITAAASILAALGTYELAVTTAPKRRDSARL
ncbi:MAG: hypothetical protein HDT07_06100 [Bacteroidales bacterium]|nr:hypothetical protein [Bacteroidales bacterium]